MEFHFPHYAFIHRSAWKVNSAKLNFRFTDSRKFAYLASCVVYSPLGLVTGTVTFRRR